MENEDMTLVGSVDNVPRNAHRLGRAKEAIHNVKEEKLSKDLGTRPRSYYDDPDYDTLEDSIVRSSNLSAPPLPGYEQRWISMTKDKGSHLLKKLQSGGWSVRDPRTVPYTAGLNTGKWGEIDAIVAGNELILCCMRKEVYDKRQRAKHEDQLRRTQDTAGFGRDLYGASTSFKSNHLNVYNPVVERN